MREGINKKVKFKKKQAQKTCLNSSAAAEDVGPESNMKKKKVQIQDMSIQRRNFFYDLESMCYLYTNFTFRSLLQRP